MLHGGIIEPLKTWSQWDPKEHVKMQFWLNTFDIDHRNAFGYHIKKLQPLS